MLATLGFIGMHNIYRDEHPEDNSRLAHQSRGGPVVYLGGTDRLAPAAVMTVGAVSGVLSRLALFAAHFPSAVRQIITAIGFIISGVTFYKEFVH